jgi:hypothetical protein
VSGTFLKSARNDGNRPSSLSKSSKSIAITAALVVIGILVGLFAASCGCCTKARSSPFFKKLLSRGGGKDGSQHWELNEHDMFNEKDIWDNNTKWNSTTDDTWQSQGGKPSQPAAGDELLWDGQGILALHDGGHEEMGRPQAPEINQTSGGASSFRNVPSSSFLPLTSRLDHRKDTEGECIGLGLTAGENSDGNSSEDSDGNSSEDSDGNSSEDSDGNSSEDSDGNSSEDKLFCVQLGP